MLTFGEIAEMCGCMLSQWTHRAMCSEQSGTDVNMCCMYLPCGSSGIVEEQLVSAHDHWPRFAPCASVSLGDCLGAALPKVMGRRSRHRRRFLWRLALG